MVDPGLYAPSLVPLAVLLAQAAGAGTLERLGLPLAICAAFAWAFRYMFWPMLVERMRKADENAATAQRSMDTMKGEFLQALERRDEIIREILELRPPIRTKPAKKAK